jgi:hypothetical protein
MAASGLPSKQSYVVISIGELAIQTIMVAHRWKMEDGPSTTKDRQVTSTFVVE